MRNQLKIIVLLASALQACGGGTTDGKGETVSAPIISGSNASGLAFSAVNRDRNIRTSRIYYYDFNAGTIKQSLSGESGSPALFYKDNRLFVLNRDSSQQNLRIIEDVKFSGSAAISHDLSSLAPGDPWSLETVTSGKSVVLGAPESGKIHLLDYLTGDLTDIDTSALTHQPLRATGMYRSGSVINVVHSGVKKLAADSYMNDGSQAVYRMQVDANGGISLRNENTATSSIDGTALKATNPVIAGADSSSIRIVGLCNNVISGCHAAIQTFSNGVLSTENDFTNASSFKYQIVNQIVEGQTPQEFYAHVQTPDGQYKLIQFNAATLAAKEVHTFSDYNLYGFAYDKGSDSLFVGEAGSISGSMYIYRNNYLQDEIELGGVLFSSALIP